jgi:CO dehydrogenase/acetyl-CoA synthase gamma subunit (corrinoid Fe-S protein)
MIFLAEEKKTAPETEVETKAKTTKKTSKKVDLAEYEKLHAELTAQKDLVLRTAAEFDNFKRRTEKERLAAAEFTSANLLKKLLPILSENVPQEVILAFAEEDSYENIVQSVIKHNHILVLRTPIDINIAKELNILTIDKGLNPERILIDPDMGGLGYGLDYGFSIIEKIRQAAFDGDNILNMPIIAFIGEETYRAKEAKSDTFSAQWGDYSQRASMWEISGATAMISAGADIVVLWNLDSVQALKGVL